jgi:hypothetical protein
MNPTVPIQSFMEAIQAALQNQIFIKLKFSKPIHSDAELKAISIKLVDIKQQMKMQFVYSYQKKDITSNFEISEGIELLKQSIGRDFKNCMLFSTQQDVQLLFNKKMQPSVIHHKPSHTTAPSTDHDHIKQRLLTFQNKPYLKALGIVTQQDAIAHSMIPKWNQINKFVEIVHNTLKNCTHSFQTLNVLDMGSGKGYLTFALYDYLVNHLSQPCKIRGVELRKDLVDFCNNLALQSDFTNLSFETNSINEHQAKQVDLLIALHACNTATDDAIYKAITSDCSIIILSPCCHQQIRPELNITNELQEICKHGILRERMAEILTDTMRSLILEAYGYKTQIFEFISDEHTHKNLMLIGVKKETNPNRQNYFVRLKNLKSLFGVGHFYLEDRLNKDKL